VKGSIEVNGEPRDLNKFGRQACYIMQENELRPLLTAREAMTYAAKLKLGGGSHAPSNKAIGFQVSYFALYFNGARKCMRVPSGNRNNEPHRLNIGSHQL